MRTITHDGVRVDAADPGRHVGYLNIAPGCGIDLSQLVRLARAFGGKRELTLLRRPSAAGETRPAGDLAAGRTVLGARQDRQSSELG